MAAPKHQPGLGRGLGELFQKTTVEAAPPASVTAVGEVNPVGPQGSQYREIPVDSIQANPQQPRMVFDPEQLEELSESIKEVGLLQPIVVRPLDPGRYELVMGERRFRASKLAGLTVIPAIIRPTEVEDLLRDALLENIHRVQLNPLEEAAAYQQLLSDFGCTQEELAERSGLSLPTIKNIEGGKPGMRKSTIDAIASALNIDVSVLSRPARRLRTQYWRRRFYCRPL